MRHLYRDDPSSEHRDHYNRNQPRVPAGRRGGGQWTHDASGGPNPAGPQVLNRPRSVPSGKLIDAIDPPHDFGRDDPIVQVAQLRGLALPRPQPGPVTPNPPGVDWQSETGRAIMRLWDLFQSVTSGSGVGSGGNRNGPGCKEEWDAARKDCEKELAKPNPNRGFTGGYSDVENCARGHVSERCGGNDVEYPQPRGSQTGRSSRGR